jgi:cyclophilin family peptidyl-prolyl cis-trans isomerase/HEAT repeat protein
MTKSTNTRKAIGLAFAGFLLISTAIVVVSQEGPKSVRIPPAIMVRILMAEDERHWDEALSSLLAHADPAVRKRAALAAGRIGDERGVLALIAMFKNDMDQGVRTMAAFALGETESAIAGDALATALSKNDPPGSRARVVEALGKITAALPQTDESRLRDLRRAVLGVLEFEARRSSAPDTDTTLMALTAVLRARPENAGDLVAEFLTHSDPSIRADAANTLARLRAKNGNEQLKKLLTADPDAVVRANAARVLGATEEKSAHDSLLDRALKDEDLRVRVSAIRALAAIKETRATEPLTTRGNQLVDEQRSGARLNELLEIATTLGRLAQNTNSTAVVAFLDRLRSAVEYSAPEVEIAKARVAPNAYSSELQKQLGQRSDSNWRVWSAIAQGAAELANAAAGDSKSEALRVLTNALSCPQNVVEAKARPVKANAVNGASCTPIPTMAMSDFLRAYAAFKQPDTAAIMRSRLSHNDVIVRSTAADLLGELPPDDANSRALIAALPQALAEKESNDAPLSILDALGKQKTEAANQAIQSALNSRDHIVRRRAISVLKANGAGEFSSRIGTVQTGNTRSDYLRVINRFGKKVQATINTTKGSFTIEFYPEDAPLTVDNFIGLAKKGYFRGIAFHRVVPNFVIQGGDPRGDGSGGPGYQIRCEINEISYARGAVGMALSGKDTGGSQWFVTHSPQPHLDGGYTVFGRVVSGMEVVDSVTRGDVIRSVVVREVSR